MDRPTSDIEMHEALRHIDAIQDHLARAEGGEHGFVSRSKDGNDFVLGGGWARGGRSVAAAGG